MFGKREQLFEKYWEFGSQAVKPSSEINFDQLNLESRYNEKLINYEKKKNEIFNDNYNRGVRDKFKDKKNMYKAIVESLFDKPSDCRIFLEIKIENQDIVGMLDTGANITCLGYDGLEFLSKIGKDKMLKSMSVKMQTAGGEQKDILGRIEAQVEYKGRKEIIPIFVCPQLKQKLYLGINFARTFNLFLDLIDNCKVD